MNPAPIKPAVPVSALDALDIRVGTIEAVEDVPNSKKLLRLIVNFGDVSAVPTLFLFDGKGRTASVLYGAPPGLHAEAEASLAALLP